MFKISVIFLIVALTGRLYGYPNIGETSAENDDCAQFCDGKYSSEADLLKSCKDGCKVSTKVDSEKSFGDDCRDSCSQAYKDKPLEACFAACDVRSLKKGLVNVLHIEVQSGESSPIKDRLSSLADIMIPKMDNALSRLFSMMRKQMSDAWQNGPQFSKDFDPLVSKFDEGIFAPDNLVSQIDMDNTDSSENVNKVQIEPPNGGAKSTPTDQFKSGSVGNSDEFGQPIILIHMRRFGADDFPMQGILNNFRAEDSTAVKDITPLDPSPPVGYIAVGEDWLACVGSRIRHLSILTRWMLLVALMISVASMIWICLAVVRGTPRRRFQFLTAHGPKGGLDNVYYTTPPFTASDKTPIIWTTSDIKAQPVPVSDPPVKAPPSPVVEDDYKNGSQSPPPAYHDKESQNQSPVI